MCWQVGTFALPLPLAMVTKRFHQILTDSILCFLDIIEPLRCAFAKLMPATRTAAQQKNHWEFTKQLSESSLKVLSCLILTLVPGQT